MANLSFAEGTIHFTKESILNHSEEIKLLLKAMHDHQNSAEYSTSTNFSEAQLDEVDSARLVEDSLTISFYGNGRWSYINNLEFFFKGLSEYIEPTHFNFLKEAQNAITFSFTDFEEGCGVFYSADINLNLENKESSHKAILTVENILDISFTAENLMKYNVYEKAYDEHNLDTLLNNHVFINALSELIPKNAITLDLLKQYWDDYGMDVVDDEAIFDSISDIHELYLENIEV
ncbi:hypothetical protein MO206_002811 [Listeria monocytogenes]|nr:hypothetical protein [Listeria monocytogenes]EIZ2734031.1 hypothetical protein [Listeria monocytogenes]EIZ2736883.1 hypothetical protein [Listeria monocytogenes]EIZ2828186.1 hypothetical protein [Listeria monocytogenes]EIZ2931970.1 hypothetical protein [Listeria monocytogenes]